MKVHLKRILLNQGGYDRTGRYWGIGSPLYHYELPNGYDFHIRAIDRDDAKYQIRSRHGQNYKFFR